MLKYTLKVLIPLTIIFLVSCTPKGVSPVPKSIMADLDEVRSLTETELADNKKIQNDYNRKQELLKKIAVEDVAEKKELLKEKGVVEKAKKELSELTEKILKKRRKKLLKAEVEKIAESLKEGVTEKEIVEILEKVATGEISEEEAEHHSLSVAIRLPQVLYDEAGVYIIPFQVSHPNFITHNKITAACIHLSVDDSSPALAGKIVLIENADPGYDWVFTKNLSALITKYGGVASHMSIRCAEIGLPAAIGCGEILFEKLKSAHKILLDCKNKEILILEYTKYDNEIEARKILKSLGYIK